MLLHTINIIYCFIGGHGGFNGGFSGSAANANAQSFNGGKLSSTYIH